MSFATLRLSSAVRSCRVAPPSGRTRGVRSGGGICGGTKTDDDDAPGGIVFVVGTSDEAASAAAGAGAGARAGARAGFKRARFASSGLGAARVASSSPFAVVHATRDLTCA